MLGRRSRKWAAAAGVLALCGAPSLAQDDPRIDHATGRDLSNWPPACPFDHEHMRLEIDIPDMNTPRLTARETLTLRARGVARGSVVLHAGPMEIRSVRSGGRVLPFTHADNRLRVEFDPPIPAGQAVDVVIDYTLDYPNRDGQGLNWSAADPNGESETDRVAQIHTQGEPESHSEWFVCHDFPNERLTTELIVTVEDGFQVVSNGRLIGRRRSAPGRTTWHWLQDQPHVYYLVTMVIGKFDIVGLGGADSARPRLPITVYGPRGQADQMRRTFANTPAMIAFFEREWDEPYPWDKYAQVIVRNFAWGGMENTSATTLHGGAAFGGPEEQDGLIAHELAHQWFGDLLTCKGWTHLWLNEGFASYAEALWAEEAAPEDAKRDAYHGEVFGFLAATRMSARGSAPHTPPMVSNRYTRPDETFGRQDDVYSKGALVLHMLRQRLGRDVFNRGVRLYLDRHTFSCVETDQLRNALEDVSGQSLERFFDQWTGRPGIPRLEIDLAWDSDSGHLRVEARQTQPVNFDNPAFAFSLPLYVRGADGSGRYVYLDMDTAHAVGTFALPEQPVGVEVDPHLSVACDADVTKPLAMWLHEFDHGSTLLARLAAAEALVADGSERAAAALAAVGADPRVHPVLGRVATGLAPKEPVRCVHRGMTVESPQHAAARAGEAHATDR